MHYVRESLGPGEQLIHVGSFHWLYTFKAVLNVVLSVVLCFVLLWGAVQISADTGWTFGAEKILETDNWLTRIRKLHPVIKVGVLMVFVFALYRFAHLMVVRATTEIAVTSARVIYKRGLVARYVGEININRIEGINVFQSFWGRIFNYGMLVIRGLGVGEVILPPIADPLTFRKAIEKAKELSHDDSVR